MNEEDLQRYCKLDHFNAKTYIDGLKQNKPKYRWCGPDTYTANEKARAVADKYFDDPSRVPKYD